MKRIRYFDLLRCISFCFIIFYHMISQLYFSKLFPLDKVLPFYENDNMNIAMLGVAVLFILSGAGLAYSTTENFDIRCFYKKRFIRVLIPFYITYITYFIYKVGTNGSFTSFFPPETSAWKIIFTFFGMDEWVSQHGVHTFSLGIGEWFLGALILLYVCYPLLTWCIKHCRILTTVLLAGGFLSLYFTDFFLISRERNLITCLLAFWLGMLFIEYRALLTRWQLVIPAAVCSIILLFVPLGADMLLCMQITSIALFLVFYFIGNYVMKLKYVNSFIRYSSRISYPIFLLQHIVMSEVIHAFDNYALTVRQECLVLLAVFGAIYILAAVLMVLNRALTGSRPFRALDAFFGNQLKPKENA